MVEFDYSPKRFFNSDLVTVENIDQVSNNIPQKYIWIYLSML